MAKRRTPTSKTTKKKPMESAKKLTTKPKPSAKQATKPKAAKPKKATPPKAAKPKNATTKLPEYTNFIHGVDGEIVMSTPAWFDKFEGKGKDRIATVLVDARVWPPKIIEHGMRTSAAARLPDGRWVCVARHRNAWRMLWFASVGANQPARTEAVPFEAPPPKRTTDDTDPPQDVGAVARLHAFATTLLAIPFDGAVRARVGDGPWREYPELRGGSLTRPRNVMIDGTEYLEWYGALYDAELQRVDSLDCAHFVSRGDRVFAIHASELVELDHGSLVPRLVGHTVVAIDAGPRDTLLLTLHRDDDRGTEIDRAIYDPASDTIAVLPRALVGETPSIVACTLDGDLVLHVDGEHRLDCVTAADLAAISMIPAADLPVPPKLELAPLDDLGAASRPLVATTGDAIVIALGTQLRVHSLDAPKALVEHARPIVGVAARAGTLAALDDVGVLHTYTSQGLHVASVATVTAPRSLAASPASWLVVGADRIVVVELARTKGIEIAGALAVAVEPETDEMLIACEAHRLALWSNGELRDLPPTIEQLVAVAPLGDRKFACAGVRHLYLLDLALPELIELEVRGRRPCLAATGTGRIAICETAGSVQAYDLAGVTLAAVSTSRVYYSKYSRPDDQDITVHGVVFMDDGRLVILLDEGRANIVDPESGTALKLDPQPGDPASGWVFITDAGILIA